MAVLTSPGVSVSIQDDSNFVQNSPTTTPLVILATRKNKINSTGTAIATGTTESKVIRSVTSQTQVLETLGVPAFMTSNGAPLHGHETNEYGLWALWNAMATTRLAYYVRADIDLDGVTAKSTEPTRPAADGTYWLSTSAFVGAMYRRNSANTAWVAVNSSVYTTTPGNGDGAVGDIAFDYSTTAGTLRVKTSNVAATGTIRVLAVPTAGTHTLTLNGTTLSFIANGASPSGAQIALGTDIPTTATAIAARLTALSADNTLNVATYIANGDTITITHSTPSAASNNYTLASSNASILLVSGGALTGGQTSSWVNMGSTDLTTVAVSGQKATSGEIWISASAPAGAGANDYWWNSSQYKPGIFRYSTLTQLWTVQPVIVSLTEPVTTTVDALWEDLSSVLTDGAHPLKRWNGSAFVAATYVVSASEPRLVAANGDLWYNASYSDFAMYIEDTNRWVSIATTTNSNPSNRQKVISSSAPSNPATGAIWIDTNDLENFPVVKRYNGVAWENISNSVTKSGEWQSPTLVPNGTLWINLADPTTQYTVKEWDSTYEPPVVDLAAGPNQGLQATFNASTHKRWKPVAGTLFGRKAQRFVVVKALQEAIVSTPEINSPSVFYQIIVAPGYPECFDEMASLNISIDERAHVIPDVPFTMVPSGVVSGRTLTVTEWKTNARGASETGEGGFSSSGYAYASMYYPHGLATNANGATVFVPASAGMLRTYGLNDQNAAAWVGPFGDDRGGIPGFTSIGYLDNNSVFKPLTVNDGDAGLLYSNSVNPIRSIYRVGIRNMGNKTTLGANSELASTNVARLISKIRFDLQDGARRFLGRPNDASTWAEVENYGVGYLVGLANARALEDFAFVCNSETNTAPRRARRELWCNVGIIPLGNVEFIYIPIRIASPGSTL